MANDRTDSSNKTQQEESAQPACRSMHENVETWEDTCVCEPEPRWQALAEELAQNEQSNDATKPRNGGSQAD
ncbi:MAG TPA: hypothetical protein PL151_02055 [Phycisphaerae bacterium]|nr:hypothetical protein [Phycisphaerae bacterium]HOJ73080.1 hypothetical protein [Phycisphaerae bacterium]HOM52696.1 hypothetical protein [Phycisphaerae bacterium]HON66046.1 hypothetical protein [Phycisphaerae bacterium]HOQ85049.1 hypothetical protein [Phycisphaerae bacterium]